MALVLVSGNFILTRRSVILCPHGGMVMHVPLSVPTELINGEVPLLFNDFYPIVGCPNIMGDSTSPCIKVHWATASTTRHINGVPVLIHTSVGLCQSASNISQGMAMISSFQTTETD